MCMRGGDGDEGEGMGMRDGVGMRERGWRMGDEDLSSVCGRTVLSVLITLINLMPGLC